MYFDEVYEWSVVRFNAWWSAVWDGIDRWIFSGITELVSWGMTGLSWVSRATDEFLINKGFDTSCLRLSHAAGVLSRLQNGQLQRYLRVIGIAVAVLVLVLLWGCSRS